ncbi:MAG: DNA primase small subunit domain-containing protein [Candidatus Nanoarchaeia archaeon]
MKKVKSIAQSYYARKDIQEAIYEFCKNRETIPRYLEQFGKRPDMLDYQSDILNEAKKGATSFHCSEEIWQNPLAISTSMSQDEYNNERTGWDFLIDIDSKYLDYSKIAAKLLIKALKYHGIENIGLKFSGSKGFHLLIPWKAFPKQISGEQTKHKFPEYPRVIAAYLKEMIQPSLSEELAHLEKNPEYQIIYKPTGEIAEKSKLSKYICPNCKSEMQSTTKSNRKKLRCPNCNGDTQLINQEEIYISKNDNSNKHPENFIKKPINKDIDAIDIILVASRHLFRAPYSLHEKTALSSAVINTDEIDNFQPSDADP